MCEIIEIDTSKINSSNFEHSLYKVREQVAGYTMSKYESLVTVLVQAYNGIAKTRTCVESLIRTTEGVDCDVWLIDNGSTDGTFEYFKTVKFEKMHILRLTENKGSPLPWHYFSPSMLSKYVVIVASDLVFTNNWLINLIKAAESDPKIGMVNPMSSNVSNLQQINLNFANNDELQAEARKLNVSDPRKWQERLRIVTIGTIFKKECLYAIGVPLSDVGFAHNFGDDDISFRVRRAGYKVILAGDTWIHHDDDKSKLSLEQARKMNEDLEIGRQNFRDKYFGIDAWNDVNNFIPEYLTVLKPNDESNNPKILGIDVKCGTPILEIKNKLRQFDIYDAECYAFTSNAKYLIDLQTVCGAGNVFCSDLNGFQDSFGTSLFNHIVVGNDINSYPEPLRIIDSTVRLLRKGGQLFISIRNTFNIYTFLNMLGNIKTYNPEHALNYTVEEFLSILIQKGYNAEYISARSFNSIDQELIDYASSCMKKLSVKDVNEAVFRLISEKYFFVISK